MSKEKIINDILDCQQSLGWSDQRLKDYLLNKLLDEDDLRWLFYNLELELNKLLPLSAEHYGTTSEYERLAE